MRCVSWIATLAIVVGSATFDAHAASATEIIEYRLPPETLAKAEALYRTNMAVFFASEIYRVAVLVLVLALGIAPRLREVAERARRNRFAQATVFVPPLLLSIAVLLLPLDVYGHYLQRSYGLSVQSWSSWFWDWVKSETLILLIATPLIWGLYAILRRSPNRWWLYCWLASIPVVLLLVLVTPIFIDPLFNSFSPLEEKQPQLLREIERVIERGELRIERARMFEMEASDKVTTYNAYVTGIGASKRVVVWDNTARDLSIPETMFVFGHEQGHYVLNHVWLSVAFAVLALLLAMCLAYRAAPTLLARFGSHWRVHDVRDWASLPLLMLLFSLILLVGRPIATAFSRHLEHQADTYGLEVTHGLTSDSPQAAAHALQKLGEKGLAYPSPNPLYVLWLFTHPPIDERVRFALEYRPWDQGQPTRYIK